MASGADTNGVAAKARSAQPPPRDQFEAQMLAALRPSVSPAKAVDLLQRAMGIMKAQPGAVSSHAAVADAPAIVAKREKYEGLVLNALRVSATDHAKGVELLQTALDTMTEIRDQVHAPAPTASSNGSAVAKPNGRAPAAPEPSPEPAPAAAAPAVAATPPSAPAAKPSNAEEEDEPLSALVPPNGTKEHKASQGQGVPDPNTNGKKDRKRNGADHGKEKNGTSRGDDEENGESQKKKARRAGRSQKTEAKPGGALKESVKEAVQAYTTKNATTWSYSVMCADIAEENGWDDGAVKKHVKVVLPELGFSGLGAQVGKAKNQL